MRVISVTYTDALSGAGIAARRLNQALSEAGTDVKFLVAKRRPGSNAEQIGGRAGFALTAARQFLSKQLIRLIGASTEQTLSASVFPTGLHRRLGAYGADVVHLHWVCAEMIRIEEISKISAPIVWTLHDEWFIRGLEHYGPVEHLEAQVQLPSSQRGRWVVVDQWVRRRKAKHWMLSHPLLVCPSHWLAQRVVASGLAPQSCVHVVPNPVPTTLFRPRDPLDARSQLGLPSNRVLIGFGAIKSVTDPRKGYALLKAALEQLREYPALGDATLVVFGAEADAIPVDFPIDVYCAGTISSEQQLALLYSALDAFICPSTQDNLPNTVAEALSCGVPCVAFRVGGLPDLVKHRQNGYLAEPFVSEDLVRGLEYCIDPSHRTELGISARQFAEAELSPVRVAAKYLQLYQKAILLHGGIAR